MSRIYTEAEARKSSVCLICGAEKTATAMVCWGACWRGEDGLKHFAGTFEEWQAQRQGAIARSTQHTPGPWRQHESDGKTYASVRSQAGQCVADCGSRSDLIAQANARLIAAAPDLLAALQMFMAEYGGDTPERANRPEQIAARAAIAKAEGQP